MIERLVMEQFHYILETFQILWPNQQSIKNFALYEEKSNSAFPFYSLSIPFPFVSLTWIIEKHWGGPTSNIWVQLGVQSCPRGSWTIDCRSWTRYPTRTCTVTCIASSSVASDLEIEIKYNYKFIFYSLFVLFVSVDTFQEGYTCSWSRFDQPLASLTILPNVKSGLFPFH